MYVKDLDDTFKEVLKIYYVKALALCETDTACEVDSDGSVMLTLSIGGCTNDALDEAVSDYVFEKIEQRKADEEWPEDVADEDVNEALADSVVETTQAIDDFLSSLARQQCDADAPPTLGNAKVALGTPTACAPAVTIRVID